MASPSLVILAGPNGAGKSTLAPLLLKGRLGVNEFVNADVIAAGLSGFSPETASIAAGRIMLARIKELARRRTSFSFETTLATRSYASWLPTLLSADYQVHLVYLWLPSADMAVRRVAARVALGGHDVPESVIRRRFLAGMKNFLSLYRSLATTWRVYDSSDIDSAARVAFGTRAVVDRVDRPEIWARLLEMVESGV